MIAVAVAAACLVAAVLAVAAGTGAGPSRSVDRRSLEQELADQFHARILAEGDDLPVRASCTSTGSGGRSFVCRVDAGSTPADPAGSWTITVTCDRGGGGGPVCRSSGGDALQ